MKKDNPKRRKSAEELRTDRTALAKCNIDAILADKIKKLNGDGMQRATATLRKIYRLKKAKAPDIEIFDEMVVIARIMRDYTSKIKGKQQLLLDL